VSYLLIIGRILNFVFCGILNSASMRKAEIFTILIIAISFLLGIYLYPQMPSQMASHWSASGKVDDYLPKFWALFLMPLVLAFLFLMYILIPKVDPLKENIEKFRKYFDVFFVILAALLFYLYLLTIFWNLGKRFNMAHFLIPAFALLFYYCGVLVEKAKRNWFIGIRTPWTLSSEVVWEKTHKLGGNLFKGAGIIALFGLFFGELALWLVVIPVVAAAFYAIAYSYFQYQKEEKLKKRQTK
jgi:uncharacterized membrane protein